MDLNTLRWVLWIVCGLFTALTVYAAVLNIRNPLFRTPCALILCGCVAMAFAIFASVKGTSGAWLAALAGSVAICAGALWNGKRVNNLALKYHVFRFILCALFVAGFAFL